ncbi:hypothetical protein F1559_001970 [Cyanidiococcus yangmingshanensis]|uniref:Uncharacterized protein n=1 Tax=Cyanidiococcus yangmingshanensis TaxID=2690220 RepID=A0A7J7IKJ9_9RHOD|nr:hypothetical protein F1559_001970 [Cyanidiococcus yangmingshanensis]
MMSRSKLRLHLGERSRESRFGWEALGFSSVPGGLWLSGSQLDHGRSWLDASSSTTLRTRSQRRLAVCAWRFSPSRIRERGFTQSARGQVPDQRNLFGKNVSRYGVSLRSLTGCSSESRRSEQRETGDSESGISVQPEVSTATIAREVERSFDTVLQELAAIQSDSPRNIAILGTRHCSYLHQQIIELLTFANVLLGNHVITSGGIGSNMAVIRGALRADKPELLTVVLPQSIEKQPGEVRELLERVTQIVEMKQNDGLPLDVASRLCNSDIISRTDRFISFAFHDSEVVLEAAREAKALNKVVTLLYLD